MLPSTWMPTDQIVSLLIAERDKLNRAIEALQGAVKRRGRPRKSSIPVVPASTTANESAPVKKRHVSAASRRKMALAQKKRWAAKKAQ
jgi:hypothetical protein